MNNQKLTPLSHTEIEQFCTALSTWHWHNNYEQFCQLLDFLPESNYAQEKWQTWKSLISLFNQFSPQTLYQIINDYQQHKL
jgi:hypothetical protein